MQQLINEFNHWTNELNTGKYEESSRIDKMQLASNQLAYEVDITSMEVISYRGDLKGLFGLDKRDFNLTQLFNSQHGKTVSTYYQDIGDALPVVASQPENAPISRNAVGHLNTIKKVGGSNQTFHRTGWISGCNDNNEVVRNMGIYTLLYEGVAHDSCAHMIGPESHLYRKPHLNPYKDIFSKRELEVLHLIADGCSARLIGQLLFISRMTVDTHRKNMIRKLEANNVPHLVAKAKDLRLI